jgi:hypothetical protein
VRIQDEEGYYPDLQSQPLPETEVRRVSHQLNGHTCCSYEIRSLAAVPETVGNGSAHQ